MESKEEEWLRFVDTLSHELKTPLTSIIAAAGLLAEELETSADHSHQKLIQTIIQNAGTLETRLAELLDIVKSGSGKLQKLLLGICCRHLDGVAVHQCLAATPGTEVNRTGSGISSVNPDVL